MAMTLYDIDAEMDKLIDPETGELLDYERYQQLGLARDVLIENTACWTINLDAEEAALDTEIKRLMARKVEVQKRRDGLKKYLQAYLQGEKYKSARVTISYRHYSALTVRDGFEPWAEKCAPELLRTKVEVNKTAVKKAIASGRELPFVFTENRESMIIR